MNTNIEHLSIIDTNKYYGNLQSNIQEWQLSSLTSLTSNNYEQTDKVQILDKRMQSSASTSSSMVIINYNYLDT